MLAEHVGVRRVSVDRRDVVEVRCCYGAPSERIQNRYGSCGAMIPYQPRQPCPECGQPQVNAHAPMPPDDARVLDGSVALVDGGEVVAAQVLGASAIASRLAGEFRQVHWDAPVNARNKPANEGRLSGIVVTHRTFGFTPPVPLRRRYHCAQSRLDVDHPVISGLIAEFCAEAEHAFRVQAPDAYAATTTRIHDLIPNRWLIAGTPWTSGIINHTAALPYHRDKNNVPGSWSAMLCARHAMAGGLLHLADYDVWLTVPHGSLLVFDGQSVVHGVSPMRPTGPNPYRFTLVTYARLGMRVCAPNPADEARRAQVAATMAEERRAAARR